MVAFKKIYNWLYKCIISCDLSVLRRKKKSWPPQEAQGKFTIEPSISERSKAIQKREIVGHLELDTVISSRGNSKVCLAIFVERKTRFACL